MVSPISFPLQAEIPVDPYYSLNFGIEMGTRGSSLNAPGLLSLASGKNWLLIFLLLRRIIFCRNIGRRHDSNTAF